MRQRLGIALGVGAAILLAPTPAFAHGLVGKQDLPIPKVVFAWAACAVLVASFAGLAALWPTPRLQELRERLVFRVPRAFGPLAGALGVAFFAFMIYAGLAGEQFSAQNNLIVTIVFVTFWIGIPFASVLVGDVFRAINPWLAIARAASWTWQRLGRTAPEPLPYPERFGRWPAALGVLAFAWVELVYVNKDDPSTLAILAIAYAVTQLVGMSLYGIRAWEHYADAFAVYFGLFARLSPLHWANGELRVRRPLEGVVPLDTPPGTVPLIVTMIGTTSFDGFSQGPLWTSLADHMQSWFLDLGLGPEAALELAFTIGLIAAVAAIGSLYRIGIAGMRSVTPTDDGGELARRFIHTLVPIALAYVVAHYFSLFVYQSQALAYLASDPLGTGSDYFGTATLSINYGVISASGVWYVQVAALLAGHIAGLILAHDKAIATYRDPKVAVRSQYWMLTVMVCFTSLGLFLLSQVGQ